MNEEQIKLREYVEKRFQLFEQNVEKALTAVGELSALHNTSHAQEHASSQRAIDKAEESVNRRLNEMNGMKGILRDAQAMFMPRAEAEANLTSLLERARALELAGKDFFTIAAFNRWTEKEQEQIRDDRKWRASITVTAGLSLLSAVIGIVIAVTT